MTSLVDQVLVYGCSEANLKQDTYESAVFNNYGPVVYAASMMDRAMSLINQDKPEEAKQYIQRSKWVLFTFVIGDDE